MSMIKIIANGSQDLGEQRVQFVKLSSRGLRGNDFKEFVKRASFDIASAANRIHLHPGETLIHDIALGATELYGANRNGDGFKIATCRSQHPTFVKHGHWFRNHNNKDPKKSYGIVKHSAFNEDMKRIELLIALNATKEAADRNHGLVADDEMDLLNKGKDIPTSMACKVAYDVCAACGNKAKNRTEYCTGEDEGGHCKRGGVKNNMCAVHADGFMNHVENPGADFFDLSKVFRGADRTSWADGIVKAASGLLIGGAELAEKQGIELPPYMFESDNPWPTRLEKLAVTLAQLEAEYDDGSPRQYDLAMSPEFHVSKNLLPANATVKQALAALTMHKILLPVSEWLDLVHGDTVKWASAEMITHALPGIYGRMLADGSIKEVSSQLPTLNTTVPYELIKWANSYAENYSLARPHLDRRIKVASIRGISKPTIRMTPLIKTAGAAETLARAYVMYQLSFLNSLSDRDEDFDLTKSAVVRNNYL